MINRHGSSLLEVLITLALFSIVILAGDLVFFSGDVIWANANTSAALQQNLRIALEYISRELQQSGLDHNVTPAALQVWVFDGTGVNADILRFSIPIVCEAGKSINNSQGNVAYWGGPLTWDCADVSCMDANNSCAVIDYKYIEYSLNSQNQLIRKILDSNAVPNVVQQKVFATNIVDFQVTPNATNTLFTVQLKAKAPTTLNQTKILTESVDVYLRNL